MYRMKLYLNNWLGENSSGLKFRLSPFTHTLMHTNAKHTHTHIEDRRAYAHTHTHVQTHTKGRKELTNLKVNMDIAMSFLWEVSDWFPSGTPGVARLCGTYYLVILCLVHFRL